MKNINSHQFTLDKLAVYLSAICAVQCLALPIAMLFLPSLSLLPLSEELFHTLLLFLVIPVSIFAMVMGCKKHKSYNINTNSGIKNKKRLNKFNQVKISWDFS